MQISTEKRGKRLLTDDQKRWILKNHKILSVEQMAEVLNIKVSQAITQCTHMPCSYFSEKAA
jgi:hypothetical protein